MRSFEFLSHTAEAGLRLEADTVEELFRAALEGMAEWLKPGVAREPDRRYPLAVESPYESILLVDFLIDALTRSQVDRVVFFDAEFRCLEPRRVDAVLLGHAVDGFDDDIKAITYHGAGIRRTASGLWQTEVIFDI